MNKFDVRITKQDKRWTRADDEILLGITHTGHQWRDIGLTKEEALMVVDEIKKYYGIE